MKRHFLLLCLAACFGAAPLSATYSYFQTDSLQNYNVSAPNWNINGTSSNSVAAGLTVTAATGGSYITKTATPDGTNQYEVAATLKLASSGGNYVMYLEATTNALLGSTSVGSFYAVAIQNPTFANGGCTATAVMDKVVNGSVTQVGSTTVPCKDGITYHAVIGTDNAVHFWVNNLEYLWWKDSTLLSGQGGVGGYSMPSGNGIDLAQIGPSDRDRTHSSGPRADSNLRALEPCGPGCRAHGRRRERLRHFGLQVVPRRGVLVHDGSQSNDRCQRHSGS